MKTCGSLKWLVMGVLMVAAAVPVCSAAIGPVTAITTDNPPGSPPYNLVSITVGDYTAYRLGTGTTTLGTTLTGTLCPENDDFDINTALNWNLGTTYSTVNFGGALWRDSNGDNPDFFMFESGGNAGDSPEIFPIFPDGSVGGMTKIPGQWKTLGYNRVRAVAGDAVDMDGQSLCGMSWAITDLKDASGKPLTNDTVIMGLRFIRVGTDPVGLFAVLPPSLAAREPIPADKAIDVLRDVVASWTPGQEAQSHDVYFGTALADVDAATRGNPQGVLVSQGQDANSYDPAGLLVLGQTYYWRVDEIDASSQITKGPIWSFTAEPVAYPIPNVTATASSFQNAETGPGKTVDGSGLANDLHSATAEHMWLSNVASLMPAWIRYEFDRVHKLQEMWVWNSNQLVEGVIGVGAKDVTIEFSTDGAAWTLLSDTQFARGTGLSGYAHNTVVDFDGAAAKYVRLTIKNNWAGMLPQAGLSEVRFFSVPVLAREPNPASGATGVSPQVTLSWRAGREAASHQVYVSTDQQAVIDGAATMATVVEPRYEPSVDLGRDYYWKVVEVNEAEIPPSWKGDIWRFSTASWMVVDDFESYNDEEGKGTRIYETWVDGYGTTTNGAQVGYIEAPFAEKTTIHGDKQSMPLSFNNTGGFAVSEATRTFDSAQDWTKHGIATLVLYFYGDPANAAGQVYVKINTSKVLYTAVTNAITTPYWTQWNIPLASVGANLKAVTKLAIGVEGSGKGIVYVDDIRLYRLAPPAPKELIWIEAESGSPTAPLRTVDDPTASGGKHISTEDLGLTGAHVDGIATYKFTVKGGVYKLQGRVIEPAAGGNSFWVRLPGATLNTTPPAAENGWMNWGFPAGATTWQWSELTNGATGIRCTLAAGTYTLEIAYREDGARLDAILITDAAE